jgi:hypothetical protein
MKHIFMLAALPLLFWQAANAQKNPVPVTISVFNDATAIPFTKLVTIPVHPGVQAGTGFFYNQRKHSQLFQTFNVGYIC